MTTRPVGSTVASALSHSPPARSTYMPIPLPVSTPASAAGSGAASSSASPRQRS